MSSILPFVSPEEIGLSAARLGRIRTAMEKHISAKRLVGGLGLIARRGKIGYFENYGEFPLDAIARIYSMTKAVTAVAALMLFEEGAFALADPIAKFLPQFSKMQIGVEAPDSTGKLVLTGTIPAERQITILDLMRHTTGFNYFGGHDEKGEMFYPQRGLSMTNFSLGMDDFIAALSELPLLREPGTAWDYSWGTDLLGRIVEVISGQTLADFFDDRIFQPLGMHDTGFQIPEEKWSRIAPIYQLTQNGQPAQDGTVQLMPGPIQSVGRKPPRGFFGGGGLLGTALDYVRLTQMLLNGGELDGLRLLSRMTVDLMHSDLLGNLPSANPLLAPGHGFGITVAINKGPAHSATLPAPGQYRWGGMAGTAWWVDPREEMTAVFFMQTLLDLTKRNQFMQLAYQSIVD